jgi:FMN phosphatase YigB (HAD superfamily)
MDILNLLEHFNINQFFKVIIISSEVKMKKPDPKIFVLAINRATMHSPEMCCD